MAQKTKQILKSYFETGDIPTQGNYVNLIDSNLNLNETGTQILVGTLSSSFLEVENHITASGNISASGEITANKFYADGAQTSYISLDSEGLGLGTNGSWKVGTHITASGNISASGDILAANLILKDGASNNFGNIHVNTTGYSNGIYTNNTGSFIADPTRIYVGASNPGPLQINFATQDHPNTLIIFKGHITASGNISASGTIYANNFQSAGGDVAGISFTDDLFLTGNLTASGNISASGTITANAFAGNLTGDVTASGNISASGDLISKDLYIDQFIKHTGDTHTHINFTPDRIRFDVGDISYLDLNDNTSAPHDITFNDGGNNVDFKIKGNTNNNPLFKTDASKNKIGMHGVGEPDAGLHIADNLWVSGSNGHITASGNISSSGNLSATGNLKVDGSQVDFTNLPTSDPGVAGRLYNDSGTIKISL